MEEEDVVVDHIKCCTQVQEDQEGVEVLVCRRNRFTVENRTRESLLLLMRVE